MKKINVFIRCFVLIMLIVSFGACASVPKMESKSEYIGEIKGQLSYPEWTMTRAAGADPDPEFLKDQREEMKYGKWVTRLGIPIPGPLTWRLTEVKN